MTTTTAASRRHDPRFQKSGSWKLDVGLSQLCSLVLLVKSWLNPISKSQLPTSSFLKTEGHVFSNPLYHYNNYDDDTTTFHTTTTTTATTTTTNTTTMCCTMARCPLLIAANDTIFVVINPDDDDFWLVWKHIHDTPTTTLLMLEDKFLLGQWW